MANKPKFLPKMSRSAHSDFQDIELSSSHISSYAKTEGSMKREAAGMLALVAILSLLSLSCSLNGIERERALAGEPSEAIDAESRGIVHYYCDFENGARDEWFAKTTATDPQVLSRTEWRTHGSFSFAVFGHFDSGNTIQFYNKTKREFIKSGRKMSVNVRRTRKDFLARVFVCALVDGYIQYYSSEWKVVYATGVGRHLTFTVPESTGTFLKMGVEVYCVNAGQAEILYIDEFKIEE
jgi:hypothetical protein